MRTRCRQAQRQPFRSPWQENLLDCIGTQCELGGQKNVRVTYFADGLLDTFDKTMVRKFSTESGSVSIGRIRVGSIDTSSVCGGRGALFLGSCFTMSPLLASEFSLLRFIGRSSMLHSASSFYCRLYAAVRYGADKRRHRGERTFFKTAQLDDGAVMRDTRDRNR